MIYSLRGKLIFKDAGTAVIECMGVGYKCWVSQNTSAQLPLLGKEAYLLTYMQVRDDSVDLFGFADSNELESFRMLTTVNGVGARVALVILSVLPVERLALAIASGDEKTLQKCGGVGKKLASRIVLELKDKVGSFGGSMEMEKIASASPSSQSKISEAEIGRASCRERV